MYSPDTNPDVSELPFFERGTPGRKRWYHRWWGKLLLLALALGLVVAAAFGIYVLRVSSLIRSGQLDPQSFLNQPASGSQPAADRSSLATDDDPSVGPAGAAVVIVEFSDFQCPYCSQDYPVVKQLIRDYGDRVRFIYRDFPLVDTPPRALPAALAANCAFEQGKFWEMHDKIFENQAALEEADLKRYAIQIGLNSVAFGGCLSSGKYVKEIEDDYNAGIEAGVEATPTFFVNGTLVRGAVPYEALQQLIVAELNR